MASRKPCTSNLLLVLFYFAFTVAATLHLNLLTTTVEELSFHLASGHVTSAHIVGQYLAQIEAHNVNGLGLHAVIETAPKREVLDIAARLDYDRKMGRSRGPLHGIPVLVEDNIATHPELGMRTTAGSLSLQDSIVSDDAVLIAKLRKAGAIILGKTNMSEWANIRATPGNIPNGWSARGGQTQSAYVSESFNCSERDPSGSSSGSAVGLSAGFAPLSLGTGSSLVFPANRAALYGIKPTVGSVSSTGVIPVAPKSMDSVGVMAKSVWDLAVGLGAIVEDEGAGERYVDAMELGGMAGWEGVRIGVLDKGWFYNESTTTPQIIQDSLAAISKMQSSGATIIDVTIPSIPSVLLSPAHLKIVQAEFKSTLQTYLFTLFNSTMHTLSDIIAFNELHSTVEMPPDHCCQELFLSTLTAPGADSPEYTAALKHLHMLSREQGIDYALRAYNVDVLMVPTEAPKSATLSAVAGYPVVTAPLGYVRESGRPFGVNFMAGWEGEEVLMRVLGAWEVEFGGGRRVPGVLDTEDSGGGGLGGVEREL